MWSRERQRLCRQHCRADKNRFLGHAGSIVGDGRPHVVLKSGSVVWCTVCGSYAESKAVGLRSACTGPPVKTLGAGGRLAQLHRLRASRHPVTGAIIPAATEIDGTPVGRSSGYARLTGACVAVADRGFLPYVPADLLVRHTVEARDAKSAMQKAAERLAVVRARSARDRRLKRAARKASIKVKADELIESFVNGFADPLHVDSDEEFWSTLDDRDWSTPLSVHPADVHCEAPAPYCGLGRQVGTRVSRASRLGALRG